MKLGDAFFVSKKNLVSDKLRTFLTLMGIIVGIAFVMTIGFLGQGFTQNITNQLYSTFGTDALRVTPSLGPMAGTTSFSDGDIKKLKRISGVRYVFGVYTPVVPIYYKGYTVTSRVVGINPGDLNYLLEDRNLQLNGTMWNKDAKSDLLVGATFASTTFPKKIYAKEKVRLNQTTYTVRGIIPQSSALFNRAVFAPLDSLRALTCNSCTSLSGFIIIMKRGANSTSVSNNIERILDKKYGADSTQVLSPSDLISKVLGLLETIKLFILFIAGISLLIGGIGISNTMFSSILNQTRQIGLMKATGAKNSDIFTIVILEGGITGLIGGIIGVFLGVAIAFGADFILIHFLSMHLFVFGMYGVWYALGLLVFSFTIGVISGLIPATRASKINPVDALRYE